MNPIEGQRGCLLFLQGRHQKQIRDPKLIQDYGISLSEADKMTSLQYCIEDNVVSSTGIIVGR